jgi:hypothetical protein
LNSRVETLLKKMTLDEKLGQLASYSGGYATGPGASNLRFDELVEKGQLGSLLNVIGVEATNHYQHIAVEKSRLHIPVLFGQDVIHGHRTTFPVPLARQRSRGWRALVRKKLVRTALHGSFRRWLILRAIRAGDASSSPREKILTWVRQWRGPL